MEKITFPEGPFLCPACAGNIARRYPFNAKPGAWALRYCEGDRHCIQPRCPEHGDLLRLNHDGSRARCPRRIGPHVLGGKAWCSFEIRAVRYSNLGNPLPWRDWIPGEIKPGNWEPKPPGWTLD